MIGSIESSLVILTILAFSTFLAGLYLEGLLIIVGVSLGVLVAILVLIQTYVVVLTIIVIIIAIIIATIFARSTHHR